MDRVTSIVSAGESDAGIRLIGVFKLCKAALLLLLGIGATALLHKHAAVNARHWVTFLLLRQENRYVRILLSWLMGFNRRNLKFFEISTFVYSGLLWIEGIGLLWLKRWAEYLTIVMTSLLIPFELYANFRHPSIAKTLILIINVAVVWYLASKLSNRHAPA